MNLDNRGETFVLARLEEVPDILKHALSHVRVRRQVTRHRTVQEGHADVQEPDNQKIVATSGRTAKHVS